MTPHWIVVPFLNAWDMTEAAIQDFLAQTGLPSPSQVLAIDTGSRNEIRDAIDQWVEREPRLHCWHWRPSLPSLAAVWNEGLRFVWGQGGGAALVVNNDVRLHPETYLWLTRMQILSNALFVSAVGRREGDLDWEAYSAEPFSAMDHTQRGGPDFSCFLITKEAHEKYPFDEGFIPAFFEDNDSHRRFMLGGDGSRIFSCNLPYLHYGSGTINQDRDPAKLAEWARRIETARQHYIGKWGGVVGDERWTIPFDPRSDQDGVTNPELQAKIMGGSHATTDESTAELL